MISVRSNDISLKYQRFTTLGFKDIGIRKLEFVAKNQLFFGISKNILSSFQKMVLFKKGLKSAN